MLARVRAFFERILGSRYAAAVSTLDRALTAFGLVFATKLIGGDGFDIKQLAHLSYWGTAATAAILAALSVLKSSVMIATTGTPALLSLTSTTLRQRRSMGRRPEHKVPLRPPTRRARPTQAVRDEELARSVERGQARLARKR